MKAGSIRRTRGLARTPQGPNLAWSSARASRLGPRRLTDFGQRHGWDDPERAHHGWVIERDVCNAGRAKHWASAHPTSAGTHG